MSCAKYGLKKVNVHREKTQKTLNAGRGAGSALAGTASLKTKM